MNSLWIDSVKDLNKFSKLSDNIEADICIVGAGILGVTCAYYLTNLGYNIVILEKNKVGQNTTGHTTAKITSQHDLFYNYLINSYGKAFAKDYLTANEEAINNIKSIIDKENISCDFEFQNSYVYTTNKPDVINIKNEVNAVNSLGFNCEFVTKVGLPFEIQGAICFKNQAQFNPMKYLYGLCNCIVSKNGKIYTDTTVTDLKKDDDNNYIVFTNANTVKAKYVIIASHYPFINFPGFYFSKLYQSTSYVIAVDPKKTLFNGMYISFDNPTFSYRTASYNGKRILLMSGPSHKTGKPDSSQNYYQLLEDEARKFYPNCEVLYNWSTEDCESLDRIPYIGPYSTFLPNVFVGTAFKKWGMTSSNVAANIIVDMICNKQNKYQYLFDSTRLKPIKNRTQFKNFAIDSSKSLVFNKFKDSEIAIDNITINSGGIIDVNNTKVGIYKNSNGNIYAVKPICTHLGCLLSWNDLDKTWDCPCHGSKFDYKGKNIYGPAIKDLEVYDLGN